MWHVKGYAATVGGWHVKGVCCNCLCLQLFALCLVQQTVYKFIYGLNQGGVGESDHRGGNGGLMLVTRVLSVLHMQWTCHINRVGAQEFDTCNWHKCLPDTQWVVWFVVG